MSTTGTNKQNTQNSVYNALRKSIITLNLLPGTTISENEISQKYNVSRTPVRETFIQLAKESLLEIVPQRGTRVSLIDLDRMKMEYFLRKSLESAVIEPFIAKAGPIALAKLEECIEKQIKLLENKDNVNFIYSDDIFHKIIFDYAGQKLSWDIIENFSGHYYRVRLLTVWQKGIAKDIIDQHVKLLEALKEKNLKLAISRLDEHLLKIDREVEQLLEQFPQYFTKTEKQNNFDVDFGGLQLN